MGLQTKYVVAQRPGRVVAMWRRADVCGAGWQLRHVILIEVVEVSVVLLGRHPGLVRMYG